MPSLIAASPLNSVVGNTGAAHHSAGGLEIAEVSSRSIVRVIAHMDDAAAARESLPDTWPSAPLTSTPGDPAGIWLAPNQCLLVSDTLSPETLTETTRAALGSLLCCVSDVSSALTVLSLAGPESRTILSSGCGLNFQSDSFAMGQCARTRFADVPLLIHRLEADEGFVLYLDRSYARHLWAWLIAAT